MAEQIVNEFTVNRPIDEAWPVMCDLERIAPCLPGAQLKEIEGTEYRGIVKVKLGAVATQFKGAAHVVDQDDDAHTITLRAEGRDTGGRGNAAADIRAEAEALSPTSTRVQVVADLHVTGKVAQFSRGIMGDVSKKLMAQFADNLNTMLADLPAATEADGESGETSPDALTSDTPASDAVEADTPGTDEAGDAPAATSTGPTPGAATTAPAAPTVRKIDGPAAEPIDVAGMAGPALAKRIAPALIGLLVVLLLLRRRRS